MFLIATFIVYFISGVASNRKIADLCLQDPVSSIEQDCRARIPTFFYNYTTRACDCFYYKGCGGSENRFNTLRECRTTCDVNPHAQKDRTPCDTLKKNTRPTLSKPSPSNSQGLSPPKPAVSRPPSNAEICRMRMEQGDCFDYIPSFFYNRRSGICDCFIYSGCKGNLNRFKTLEQCMGTCNVIPAEQPVTETCKKDFEGTNILLQLLDDPSFKRNADATYQDACEQSLQTGTCRAYIPSFYYNRRTGACDCFIYTGCQGNENRFRSLYDCTRQCGVPLGDQEITSTCKDHLRGTQTLIDLENDLRLRGNNRQDTRGAEASQTQASDFGLFPALPAFVEGLPRKVLATLLD